MPANSMDTINSKNASNSREASFNTRGYVKNSSVDRTRREQLQGCQQQDVFLSQFCGSLLNPDENTQLNLKVGKLTFPAIGPSCKAEAM
jgi:hypothetical protein